MKGLDKQPQPFLKGKRSGVAWLIEGSANQVLAVAKHNFPRLLRDQHALTYAEREEMRKAQKHLVKAIKLMRKVQRGIEAE